MPTNDVVLSEAQRLELSRIVQSRSLPAGYVFRARLILMLAEGASFNTIKRQLRTTAPTISRWKARFLHAGMDGLDTVHPGQLASVLTPTLRARILSATRRKPADGSTHWSCRKLAAILGISNSVVHRTWKEAGLKPLRLERYMASDDPDFESKAADIIGLYLNPPRHAAVFCVDEKTAIQALDRLDPVLPLSPRRAERHGFEYYRHGTLSLYAALDTASGRVHGKTAARHTSLEFVAFLKEVVSLCPRHKQIHIILAIAIDPVNAKNIWVGSGESWERNSASMGDGVYRSIDGGDNWTNVGLPESEESPRSWLSPETESPC